MPVQASYDKSGIISLAHQMVVEKWGESEWQCFDKLIKRESNYNPNAKNPTSTAYGIGQFLDSTWKGTGIPKTSDPQKQLDAIIIYLTKRYQTPCNSWSHSQNTGWY